MDTVLLEEIRRAIADYMGSEGCFCCQNIAAHQEHAAKLAELLNVPIDHNGYAHFYEYRTNAEPEE